MPYKSILEQLVSRIPGAVGVIMVDWEGEAVQEFCHCDPYEIRFMAAHQAILLGRLRELQGGKAGDGIEEFVMTTTAAHLIIGSINSGYSLMLKIGRDCPVRLALQHFRATVAEIRKEI
jgi:predicted regulator of Ras-like GTPase activity (Roadblock/LC7/MglB family)